MSCISSATGRTIIGSTLLAGLLGCGILVSAGTPAMGRARSAAPPITVYTPVILRRNLTRAPAAWLGRVVRVRARAVKSFVWTCQHDYVCVIRQPSLADPTVDAVDARLPLLVPADTPLVALARRVPLLERLVPRPPTIVWGHIAL